MPGGRQLVPKVQGIRERKGRGNRGGRRQRPISALVLLGLAVRQLSEEGSSASRSCRDLQRDPVGPKGAVCVLMAVEPHLPGCVCVSLECNGP